MFCWNRHHSGRAHAAAGSGGLGRLGGQGAGAAPGAFLGGTGGGGAGGLGLKLVDFGCSRDASEAAGLSPDNMEVQTLLYRAPEILRRERVGRAAPARPHRAQE